MDTASSMTASNQTTPPDTLDFGLVTGQHWRSWAELQEQWAFAEETGWDSVWAFDHFFSLRDGDGSMPRRLDAARRAGRANLAHSAGPVGERQHAPQPGRASEASGPPSMLSPEVVRFSASERPGMSGSTRHTASSSRLRVSALTASAKRWSRTVCWKRRNAPPFTAVTTRWKTRHSTQQTGARSHPHPDWFDGRPHADPRGTLCGSLGRRRHA